MNLIERWWKRPLPFIEQVAILAIPLMGLWLLATLVANWPLVPSHRSVYVNGAVIRPGITLKDVESLLGPPTEGFRESVVEGGSGNLFWKVQPTVRSCFREVSGIRSRPFRISRVVGPRV